MSELYPKFCQEEREIVYTRDRLTRSVPRLERHHLKPEVLRVQYFKQLTSPHPNCLVPWCARPRQTHAPRLMSHKCSWSLVALVVLACRQPLPLLHLVMQLFKTLAPRADKKTARAFMHVENVVSATCRAVRQAARAS